ncbi:MAG: DAK2 domain-containing protein [Bacilli bacterium]
MKIIDGQIFKKMVISGANHLYNHYPEIDALNVFPVPDGDTGMNMNLTMSSGAKEVINRNDTNIGVISKSFSRGLLMGARGNSGVITSQIFRGIADGLEGKESVNAIDLAYAIDNGRKVAYKAVIKPVEGTILTVIRESSSFLLENVTEKTSIENAFEILLKEAKASLKRTPNLLPVLKEVGVVDSGGAGLVRIFEGMYSVLLGEFIEKNEVTALGKKGALQSSIEEIKESEGYSIEFALKLGPKDKKKEFQRNRFFSVLNSHGKDLKINQNDDIVKVSIHSLNPGNILSYAQDYGEFLQLSIVNTDSVKDPEVAKKIDQMDDSSEITKEEKKDYAIVATSSGDGIDEMFKEIGVTNIVAGGQTMNPSTEDFLKEIKKSNSRVCYVLPNNSNIIMAANQAQQVLKDECDVRVIPSKTIMQGIVSAMMFTPDVNADENFDSMSQALSSVKSGSVTFSIKDTDINGVHVSKDEFLAIRESKQILSSCKDKNDALYVLLKNMVDEESSIITILIGKDINDDEEKEMKKVIEEKYSDFDVDIRKGNQPIYSYIVGVE